MSPWIAVAIYKADKDIQVQVFDEELYYFSEAVLQEVVNVLPIDMAQTC